MSFENMSRPKRSSGLRDALIAAGALVAAHAAVPEEAHAGKRTESRETLPALSDRDVALLAQNAYHEARGESTLGQLAVVQVTLDRLVSGKFGKSVADVIFSPHQYSWTSDEKILMAKLHKNTFENIHALLTLTIGGKTPAEAVRALSHMTGLSPKTYYYKRSDWKENDPREKRMTEKTKKVFRSLRHVGDIGNHRFYAD